MFKGERMEDPLAEEHEVMHAEGERVGLLDGHIQGIEEDKEKEKEKQEGREGRKEKRQRRKRLFAVIFVTFVEIFATTTVDPFIIFMVCPSPFLSNIHFSLSLSFLYIPMIFSFVLFFSFFFFFFSYSFPYFFFFLVSRCKGST
jgi:hypothetical protein